MGMCARFGDLHIQIEVVSFVEFASVEWEAAANPQKLRLRPLVSDWGTKTSRATFLSLSIAP